MAKLIENYAEALLAISEEKNSLEEDLKQAILIRDTLKDEEIQTFLNHPNILNSTKYKLFQKAFSNTISEHFMSFLHLMVRKGRESLIVPALIEYINKINERSGKTLAKVVSAKALSKEQLERIHSILSKKTNKQIQIETEVDPDVIGGFYILIDGYVFDGTVRSELNNMTERLKRGINNDS